MTFMVRTSAAVFQSPSPPKAIAIRHKPLRGDAGELAHAVQIFEVVGEGAEVSAFLEEVAQGDSELDFGGNGDGVGPVVGGGDGVGLAVFGDEFDRPRRR